MRVVTMLPKEHFKCSMCSYEGFKDRYLLEPYLISYEKEFIVCKNCALREHGSKNRIKLNDIIKERTKKWYQNQKNK